MFYGYYFVVDLFVGGRRTRSKIALTIDARLVSLAITYRSAKNNVNFSSVPSDWPEFSKNDEPYLVINDAADMIIDNYPRWEQRRFWEEYLPNLAKYGEYEVFLMLFVLEHMITIFLFFHLHFSFLL